MTQSKHKFYLYYLRRPDKVDFLDPDLGQPFYIGKGSNGRSSDHRKEALTLLHKPGRKTIKIRVIHKLWRRGLDFVEDIFIDGLTEQEAFELEIEAIKEYGRIDLGTGCLANGTDGGDGGVNLSLEIRERIRRAKQGSKHTKETRQKMSQSHRGKSISKEHRRKLSLANIGKHFIIHTDEAKEKIRNEALPGGRCSRSGAKHTEEAKQKNRLAHLGQIAWNKGIPQTEEAKRKNSEGHKGKPSPRKGAVLTEETKQKLRAANLGKKHSLESRQKMSERNMGHIVSEETREKLRKRAKERKERKERKQTQQANQ